MHGWAGTMSRGAAAGVSLVAWLWLLGSEVVRASDLDEFKVKREAVFDFAQRPILTRQGDRVTIAFETKGFCDVTVAVEEDDGKIIRHLASGVLGPNAPVPFQKNTKKQVVLWDGRNDQGVYVDDQDRITVRVSLGLEPRFERTLFWSPKKRSGFNYPAIRAAKEGVYVAEGSGVDQVRLFDHAGHYLRTVYPFPADKVDQVQGLKMHVFPGDDRRVPLKRGYLQATFLSSGTGGPGEDGYGESSSVNTLAAANGRLAVLHLRLNCLAADGATGGLPLEGPKVGVLASRNDIGYSIWDNDVVRLPGRSDIGAYLRPRSAALSPDAKWLYLAGYHYNPMGLGVRPEYMNAVLRMPFEGAAEPTVFVGDPKPGIKNGSAANGKFRMVTAVACDPQGRVYVGDYLNDRVQVFDSDGQFLKAIPVAKPACVAVHQRTGDIYVFSWMLFNWSFKEEAERVERVMTHLGPLESPAVKAKCPLPMEGCTDNASVWNYPGGLQQRVELDSWSEKPTVWVVNGRVAEMIGHDDGSVEGFRTSFESGQYQVFEEADGKLTRKWNFGDEVKKSVARLTPPILWRQRLYVNPATGRLYVAEGDCGVMKAFNQLVEIHPETGKIALVDLPLGSEDLCFGPDGLAYLRTDTIVARYDPKTWKEVPWDYGEERENHSYGMGARGAALTAGLITPGHRSFNFWHLGGVDVSLRGHLVVTTCNGSGMTDAPQWGRGEAHFDYKSTYTPVSYPGRMRWGEVHTYDEHGRPLVQDAVPGMGHLNGIGIDRDDNLYMLLASRRLMGGKPFDPDLPRDASGTIVKVGAKKAKVLSFGGGGSATGAGAAPETSAGSRRVHERLDRGRGLVLRRCGVLHPRRVRLLELPLRPGLLQPRLRPRAASLQRRRARLRRQPHPPDWEVRERG
jgi:hypothetical protein